MVGAAAGQGLMGQGLVDRQVIKIPASGSLSGAGPMGGLRLWVSAPRAGWIEDSPTCGPPSADGRRPRSTTPSSRDPASRQGRPPAPRPRRLGRPCGAGRRPGRQPQVTASLARCLQAGEVDERLLNVLATHGDPERAHHGSPRSRPGLAGCPPHRRDRPHRRQAVAIGGSGRTPFEPSRRSDRLSPADVTTDPVRPATPVIRVTYPAGAPAVTGDPVMPRPSPSVAGERGHRGLVAAQFTGPEYTEQILPRPTSGCGSAAVLVPGPGRGLARRLAAQGSAVVGIDPVAESTKRPGRVARLRAVGCGGLLAEPSFGAAVACLVFEHIGRSTRPSTGGRVEPGGRFVFFLNTCCCRLGRLDRRPDPRPARAVLADRRLPDQAATIGREGRVRPPARNCAISVSRSAGASGAYVRRGSGEAY
jgi:hypothetical protein